jgi:predicted ABC-type sugar transport system permease subunit
MGFFAWYAANRPSAWYTLAIAGGLLVGVVGGWRVSGRWLALAAVPLIVASVGGVLLASRFSNTRGYAGGDWSVSAVVAVGGIVVGLLSTVAFLLTFACRWAARR